MRRPKRKALMFFVIAAVMLLFSQPARSTGYGLFPYAEASSVTSLPIPPVDIVEINLIGKAYEPHEIKAKPGDTIRICNKDRIFHSPFSYTKFNQFGSPKGLQIKPGECVSLIVQNPTKTDLCVQLRDEIHSMEKGIVVVSPEGGGFSWAGSWNIQQTASDGTKYTGKMTLEQVGSVLSGTLDWGIRIKVKLNGHIEECNHIRFSVDYGGGLAALYEGTLLDTGIEITDGTVLSNTNGPKLMWSAGR